MAVSFSGHASGHTPKLPSFRELLPDYLHDEIDSASYNPHSGSQHGGRLPPVSRQDMASKRASVSRQSSGSTSRDVDFDRLPSRPSSYIEGQSRYHTHHLPQENPYYDNRVPLTPTSRTRGLDSSDPSNYLPPLRSYESVAPPLSSPSTRHDARNYARGYDAERVGYTPSRPSTLATTVAGYPAYSSPVHASYPGHYGSGGGGDYEPASHPGAYMDAKSTKYDDAGDAKSKKRRGNLPKPTTDILRAWFYEHLDHPYPSEQDKQMFMTRTGLTISQISNWFINARRRHLPALRNQGRISESERPRPSSSLSEDDPDYDTSPSRR
ncbi:homeodomain super [Ophidiomyces ophidiicola]|uniref:Homeodomain super n=1 Tax=Ophidiomyces ophidiicola TaxID=1387563 RepID=A0ACB8V5S2_9EURO|nr:homeodomain super [Ophidiomyces ophidiicola]KAI1914787.1 homeodomain super [Ophidiomyces ophidiicola]KAI1925598.1 homeodomain super [Ophidiomyces ophidiicola]KAI2012488.1 homeodomain super [Ophidiomyces ophidiicola]KAI2025649.1 homeodomain super [Ophidiomyces ophidiicola]